MSSITIESARYKVTVGWSVTERIANNCGMASITSISASIIDKKGGGGFGVAVDSTIFEQFLSHNFLHIMEKVSNSTKNSLLCLSDRVVTSGIEDGRAYGIRTAWFIGELLRRDEEEVGQVVASPLVSNEQYADNSHAIMAVFWVPPKFKDKALPKSVHEVYEKWVATPCQEIKDATDFVLVEPAPVVAPAAAAAAAAPAEVINPWYEVAGIHPPQPAPMPRVAVPAPAGRAREDDPLYRYQQVVQAQMRIQHNIELRRW